MHALPTLGVCTPGHSETRRSAMLTPSARQEAEVIARAQSGEPTAVAALVELVHPEIVRIVRAHRSRIVAEEDLIQEVLLAMLERLDRYRPDPRGLFRHWISRVAVRVCLDRLRSERIRQRDRETVPDAVAAIVDRRRPVPEDAAAAADLVDWLLAQLPPKDRLTLTLLDLEGLSLAEVAAHTGWTVTMTKVRAFRARRRLRALLAAPPARGHADDR